MACEKVLIDYDLFQRYKGYEQKYHSLKAENEQLKEEHDNLQKQHDEQKVKIKEQIGSGHVVSPNSDLQTRIITQENGVINNQTQKIIPINNAPEETADVEPLPFETGVSNNNVENENNCEPSVWYFIDVPKNVKL